MKWTSTDDINVSLVVLAQAAEARNCTLVGTTIDFASWFRTNSIDLSELVKYSTFWQGEFRQDLRMQMGRAAAAHNAQQTSFLLVRLIREEIRKRDLLKASRLDDEGL